MSAVLVDTNVLLDIVTEDPAWLDWSSTARATAADLSRVAINPIVHAELSIGFARIEDLEAALPSGMVDRETIPYDAAFLAGKAF